MEDKGPATGWVYGLDVEVWPGVELLGVPLRRRDATPRAATAVRAVAVEEIDARWPGAGAVREREVLHSEGDLLLAIDRHDDAGYLVDAPHHGRFLVAPDGGEVLCAGRPENPGGAQAVLLGQALPLAATLAGREILHAGAVAVDDRAAVICAPSGRGKSNLIARLLLGGASLVADDAVAVAATGSVPVVHPGPSFVHLLRADARDLADGARLVPVDGYRTAKVALSAERSPEAAELAVVYLLDRGGDAWGVAIAPDPAGARSLLAATAVTAARTPERLRRHMETCGEIADRVPVRRIEGGAASREAVAAAVRDDLERL